MAFNNWLFISVKHSKYDFGISVKRFFNIKQNFNVLGGIWTENSNSNNINYYNTANSIIYGSNVYSNGIYCPITNLMDDLTIYIGLKNSNSN